MGIALVVGKKRVPKPATGNTALVTLFKILLFLIYQITIWVCALPAPCIPAHFLNSTFSLEIKL